MPLISVSGNLKCPKLGNLSHERSILGPEKRGMLNLGMLGIPGIPIPMPPLPKPKPAGIFSKLVATTVTSPFFATIEPSRILTWKSGTTDLPSMKVELVLMTSPGALPTSAAGAAVAFVLKMLVPPTFVARACPPRALLRGNWRWMLPPKIIPSLLEPVLVLLLLLLFALRFLKFML